MQRFHLAKISIILLCLTILSNPLFSIEVKTQEDINIDTSIIRADLSYSIPEQIIITPLFIQGNPNSLNSIDKFRGLYYYLIQKLGFSDIPFHYVISEDGHIFNGNLGGDERKVQVEGLGENVVLIGYLGGTLKNSFDPRSLNSFTELLLNISNRNSIHPDKTKVSAIKFVRDEETRSVNMKAENIAEGWTKSLQEIINTYKSNYSPTPKTYTATAEIISIPTEEVEPGSELTAAVHIKNTGKNGIYGGSTSALLLQKRDGGESQFFLNNAWLSKSQIEIMTEGQNLLPGQEDIYEFQIKAPLAYGEVQEEFILSTFSGGKIETVIVLIKLKMKKGDKRIVQIQNTELGYLKVRSEPSTLGLEIGRVSTGERFYILEDAGNGYLKIDLGNGQTGWIAGWLTTTL